jgi:putative spermidine/putrescine transport system permease protein
MDGLRVSVLLGLSTMLMALVLGTGVALTLTRSDLRGKGLLHSFFLSPILLPKVAIGVALFLFFVLARIPGTLLRLFVLHTIITCPYVIAAVTASLQGINPTLEEAAMNLGAAPLDTFRSVTLPLIRPGIVAGAIFGFVVSFDEVTASIFLTDAKTTTFPVALFSYLARGALDPTVAAASSFMLISVSVVGAILARSVGLTRALGVLK